MAATTSTTSIICPKCGTSCSTRDTEASMAELQEQVRLLTAKATDAADKLADYEDELRILKLQSEKQSPPTPPTTATEPAQPLTTFPSRFGASLFSRQRASPAPSASSDLRPLPEPATAAAAAATMISTRRESDLQAALAKEQEARQKAEVQVSRMNQEVEDLSVQLFQQANEMVASERKARAKLEERVQILELRDGEKRKRLERLEKALVRIERVRALLAPPAG